MNTIPSFLKNTKGFFRTPYIRKIVRSKACIPFTFLVNVLNKNFNSSCIEMFIVKKAILLLHEMFIVKNVVIYYCEGVI